MQNGLNKHYVSTDQYNRLETKLKDLQRQLKAAKDRHNGALIEGEDSPILSHASAIGKEVDDARDAYAQKTGINPGTGMPVSKKK